MNTNHIFESMAIKSFLNISSDFYAVRFCNAVRLLYAIQLLYAVRLCHGIQITKTRSTTLILLRSICPSSATIEALSPPDGHRTCKNRSSPYRFLYLYAKVSGLFIENTDAEGKEASHPGL